jgi:hypothetical protein
VSDHTLSLRKSPSAGPTPDRQPLPVGGGTEDGRAAKRIARLLSERKAAERTSAEQTAIAAAALRALREHPDIYAAAAPRLFVEAAHALAAGDLTVADTLPGVLAQLSPPAAAWIFADVSRARVLVELARHPEKLDELTALAATDQAVALGAFVAELEAARRPIAALYGAP